MRAYTKNLLFLTIVAFTYYSSFGQTTLSLIPEKDHSIFQIPNRHSNGEEPKIYTGSSNKTAPSARRALLKFSLTGIPKDAVIIDARLILYCTDKTNVGHSGFFDLHRLEESWGKEETISPDEKGLLANTGDVTWQSRFHDVTNPIQWLTLGGTYTAAVSATTIVDQQNAYFTWQGDQLIQDIQDMVTTPEKNFGWILKASSENLIGSGSVFASRENEDPSIRPVLSVTYQLTTSLIGEGDPTKTVRIVPNPANHQIQLQLPEKDKELTYQIVDLFGRTLFEGTTIHQGQPIDIQNYPYGFYFLRFPGAEYKTVIWYKTK